jgi:hypothetical protein
LNMTNKTDKWGGFEKIVVANLVEAWQEGKLQYTTPYDYRLQSDKLLGRIHRATKKLLKQHDKEIVERLTGMRKEENVEPTGNRVTDMVEASQYSFSRKGYNHALDDVILQLKENKE